MTGSQPEPQAPACYEFRIRGHLGATTLRGFPALRAETQGHDTLLRGAVADQAALHGVLAQVEALGLELLELRRLPREPDTGRITPHERHPMSATTAPATTPPPGSIDEQTFLLKRVQPALSGLMDGSLSTLAPIFAVALATHRPLTAFFTGVATALGAGVSMAFSEGLSDTGDLTGRGSPVLRGAITGGGTFAGGIFHTLPFLIPGYAAAVGAAIAVVATELLVLAWLRHKFFQTSFARSFLAITVGGAIIAALSAGLGAAAAS